TQLSSLSPDWISTESTSIDESVPFGLQIQVITMALLLEYPTQLPPHVWVVTKLPSEPVFAETMSPGMYDSVSPPI
ncbi:hypothetical protein, partial [Herbaspirillum sp.]|uniref:hypothetical protein n=1 Tax=Herbaspirillum sp. TaxID=1890675 RepID=UPI0025885048